MIDVGEVVTSCESSRYNAGEALTTDGLGVGLNVKAEVLGRVY